MVKPVRKQVYTRIPTQVNKKEFEEFFLPHLSITGGGPKCKIGYWKVFNLILKICHFKIISATNPKFSLVVIYC